jgi:HD-GYP domain-containing protein (c-di-GMP phosphodiesterase class II)
LKGADIPLGARIIAVCDAFETMVSGRGKMPNMTVEQAVAGIKKGVNIHFDPGVVKVFFAMLAAHPEVVDAKGSMDRCLEDLKMDVDAIGIKNLLKKRMAQSFPACM